MTELVLVSQEDAILRIEFNRPEKKNALTPEMYVAIAQALEEADSNSQLRVVLIHGQSDCFTAGADLKGFEVFQESEETPASVFLAALPRARKPLVAAVAGPAIGIGTTMLLHCDLVYAADNARFSLPFINLAVVPEAGSSMLLPRLAGYQRAAELLMLGEPFGAQRAHEVGIVSRVVSPDDLLAEALGAARKLAQKPPGAMVATKALLKRDPESVATRIEAENRIFSKLLVAPEAQEEVSAFFERRKPDFSRF